MRRSIAAAAAAVLSIGGLAFAPAASTSSSSAMAEPTHEVTFTESGSETVQGGMPGGANITPFSPLGDQACTDSPDGYCETVLIEVVQPVADESDDFEFGLGELTIETTADVQGSDFDLYLYSSDAEGTLGEQVGTSGNFSACATFCGVPVVHSVQCPASDECISIDVSTNEVASTKFYLLEIYYFATPAGHTTELTYTRTDGRNAAGGTGAAAAADAGDAPADSVERFDVSYFGDIPTEAGGDWNGGQNPEVGSALGQDFEGAFLEYKDDTFFFVLDMTELPAIGGTPEATRYGWSFAYVSGGERLELELDGKFTNYSRGACDPTAGTCPPPRDPGMAPFLIRGNCAADTSLPITLTLCEEFANVEATFDPSDGTITVPIPSSALAPDGVKACDRIEGSASFIGQSIWAAPSAFITNTAMPFDDVAMHTPLVVPYADATLSCG